MGCAQYKILLDEIILPFQFSFQSDSCTECWIYTILLLWPSLLKPEEGIPVWVRCSLLTILGQTKAGHTIKKTVLPIQPLYCLTLLYNILIRRQVHFKQHCGYSLCQIVTMSSSVFHLPATANSCIKKMKIYTHSMKSTANTLLSKLNQ